MDMQMPVMNGWTASNEICKMSLRNTPPIIALTANAKGMDNRKFTKVGISDIIYKPYKEKNLLQTISKWIDKTKHQTPSEKKAYPDIDTSPGTDNKAIDIPGLDTETGMAICMGEHDFYCKLLALFRETQIDFSDRFCRALDSGNLELAYRASHTLKGNAGNIGAMQLSELALKLERLCEKKRDIDEIKDGLHRVEERLKPLIIALGQYLSDT
jgi:HPt (histidine-containing phosphotransfer) domain-containing protein